MKNIVLLLGVALVYTASGYAQSPLTIRSITDEIPVGCNSTPPYPPAQVTVTAQAGNPPYTFMLDGAMPQTGTSATYEVINDGRFHTITVFDGVNTLACKVVDLLTTGTTGTFTVTLTQPICNPAGVGTATAVFGPANAFPAPVSISLFKDDSFVTEIPG